MFAAIHETMLGVNKLVFDIELAGVQAHRERRVDVFKKVDGFRPYVLSFNFVLAKDTLKISFSRVLGGFTYINGIIVVPSRKTECNYLLSSDIIAVHDCGTDPAERLPRMIRLSSSHSRTSWKDKGPITCDSLLAKGFARSARYGAAGYSIRYGIDEPSRGHYDLSLCFSEVFDAAPGHRVMDLTIISSDVFKKKGSDISAKVGPFHPCIVSYQDLKAENTIQVRLKGLKREPTLSGITVSKPNPLPISHNLDLLSAVTVNCGNGGGEPILDSGMQDNIEYIGNDSSCYIIDNGMSILDTEPLFRSMGRSCRQSPSEIEYTFKSSEDINYDVALVFCEIDSNAFGVGKRTMNVEVIGKEKIMIEKLDVYEIGGSP